MKRLMLLTAILISTTLSYARAEDAPGTTCLPPVGVQAVQVTEEIVERFADANFCSQKKPQGKPGQILIWWERDDQGRCTVQRVELVD
jgi:hypothetical protein